MAVGDTDTCGLFVPTRACSHISRTEHVVSCICGSALLAICIPIGVIIAVEVLALMFRFWAEYADYVFQQYYSIRAGETVLRWMERSSWNQSSISGKAWAKNFFLGAENNRR